MSLWLAVALVLVWLGLCAVAVGLCMAAARGDRADARAIDLRRFVPSRRRTRLRDVASRREEEAPQSPGDRQRRRRRTTQN
ncbi:MAG: hypothetical protein QOE11_2585 [Solirubrobacteraceae bacterium]|jgi:hypothetical protein|nr:hypothetical protein [Solirubrobacteraceae bacterium]